MATQNISDAICFPQDTGSGTSSNTDPADAWLLGKLASHVEGTYVDTEENPNSLAFENINISTDTADVANGTAYIIDDSTSTASDRDASGNPTFRSNDTLTSPDTSAPTRQPYIVVVPTSITGLSLDTDATNDIYISVNPTAQNDVTLHYGNGIATPSEPYIDLGTIDTTDGSTTRPNDSPDLTVDELSASTLGSDIDAGGNSLTNLSSAQSDQYSREGVLIDNDSTWAATEIGLQEDLSDVTATTFTSVGGATGAIPMALVPDGATVYGRFISRMSITGPSQGGDAVRIRPEVGDSSATPTAITELTNETDTTSNQTVDSGWVEITTLSASEIYYGRTFEAEVDSGTGQFSSRNQAVFFDWRVD